MALETRRSQTDRLSRTCNDTLLNCEREVTRLEGKLNGSALEEKQILDKLWERYELSHSDAQALRVELESVPKATRRIGELNREIKGLGAINIGAIEEFDRVNTRYTYLSDQRNDVEKANCRVFKSATGFSVMEYIIYSRVLRARQLLKEGISVQQAGEMSGFSDNSHFIRTFGHLTGTSPGRYAREYLNSNALVLPEGAKR